MDIQWRRGDDAANICRGQMNIGRRYQVAVEANGVQQRATAASHAGGLVSARMSRFRAERAGRRTTALARGLWRLMFVEWYSLGW